MIRAMKNRSVPVDTVLPHVLYKDVVAAIDWLSRTFGFVEHYRYGEPNGTVSGAQMHLGDAWIMVKAAKPGSSSPAQLGYGTQSLTIFVNDVDAHYRKVKSSGARIAEQLNQTVYGELQYGVFDLDGHHWLFSQHAKDLSPESWGAKIADKK
jgi:uncharacterized glyoxalase superfamily protein PhnB